MFKYHKSGQPNWRVDIQGKPHNIKQRKRFHINTYMDILKGEIIGLEILKKSYHGKKIVTINYFSL